MIFFSDTEMKFMICIWIDGAAVVMAMTMMEKLPYCGKRDGLRMKWIGMNERGNRASVDEKFLEN